MMNRTCKQFLSAVTFVVISLVFCFLVTAPTQNAAASEKKQDITETCKNCHDQAVTPWSASKHAAGNARARIVRFTGRSPRPCVHCGATIGPERRIDAKFCSAECNSRAHQLKRKLRTRGGGNTGFVRAEIAGRDGFTCGICAEPVDMVLAYPDPGFASLDHILPVSHGGSSEPENLRLTHLLCNVTRRNSPEVA